MNITMYNKKKTGGYTLLFSVLVSSVVLAIGISILNISKKEFLLATSARESTIAFFSADAGLECAMYHDDGRFSTTSAASPTISCGFTSATVSKTSSGGIYGTYSYTFDIRLGDTTCSRVTLNKSYINGSIQTEILTRGYNMGWDYTNSTCTKPNTRRVERALRLTY